MPEGWLPIWPVADRTLAEPTLVRLAGALVAGIGAIALAIVLVLFGPLPAALVLPGIVATLLILSDVRAGLWVVLAVIALVPYAVIPVKIVITPPLLEMTGLGVLSVWLLRLFLRRDETIPSHPLLVAVMLFIAVAVFAFVLGVDRGYSSQTYHNFAKFLVSVSLFFVAWSSLQGHADVRRFTGVFLVLASVAAAIGLVLYAGGPRLTLAVLARLIPYGYPDTRIVRYIEDDPAKPMRLTSTSVDPNSFAGLLALAVVVAVTMTVAQRPAIPRWPAALAAIVSGSALLLTYSRAGWLGAAFGIGLVALARYRWLLVPGGIGLAGASVLGFGERFVERLWQGFMLQDPATRMRLEEYRTALAIIRDYPAFGVGFGAAPTIELWTGVSSIYLLIAERMGLLGLGTFLVAVMGIAWTGWRTWHRMAASAEGDLLLAWLGAQAAALLIGFFDHYYANISFPHMVATFWLTQAIVLVAGTRSTGTQHTEGGTA
ncbi:O-antigen ligase family protein [Thermomicrobium roseum]|uniref:O-Antigen Polymerase family n=1 Tax=Thermomicrobium roseum (strain ATCC 27502 / DSM 5159 / P-2) TaxID=309801 RepID=B9L034_THERP|nr:O-antigen ligase family protein [Thermomicrobium roseum]ACM06185.1 O-Antigen Polymerase family [Thermomicrobium roseum DSM 5159]